MLNFLFPLLPQLYHSTSGFVGLFYCVASVLGPDAIQPLSMWEHFRRRERQKHVAHKLVYYIYGKKTFFIVVLTLLYKNENGKKSPTELSLPSPFLTPLSRDFGFSSNSRYRIVALKMHETFNHPEWWIDFFFSLPSSLQQKHDRTNILCTCCPWPLPHPHPHHSGQRITRVVSKQEVLSWWQSRGR